jgi:hypothetical protein
MQERTYTLIAAFACGALVLWLIFYLTESPPDAAGDKGQTVLWSPEKQINDQVSGEEDASPSEKLTDQIPADENAASEREPPRQFPGNELTYQPSENQNSGSSGKQIYDQIPPEEGGG